MISGLSGSFHSPGSGTPIEQVDGDCTAGSWLGIEEEPGKPDGITSGVEEHAAANCRVQADVVTPRERVVKRDVDLLKIPNGTILQKPKHVLCLVSEQEDEGLPEQH